MVDRKELEYIAQIAKIDFTREEGEKLIKDLVRIIEYVEKLKEVDVDGVEPMYHPFTIEQRLREDVVKNWLSNEEALLNAPDRKDGFFRVPKIIET
ncbi:MAG: Asp-tRNA(Asn)/Glu-tRNA(Gln) amidotransferase subunit GatC [Thermosulfidibacteraceae bacterium]|jgi:aspartyl-tRNA(Asn)/glutamyl-tRNA(Gln) amidotransferase subunit C